MNCHRLALLVSALPLAAAGHALAEETKPMPRIDTFDYAVGTQTIGASHQLTKEPRLIGTAKGVLDKGSNAIKFSMGKPKEAAEGRAINALMEQARDDAERRQAVKWLDELKPARHRMRS